MTAAATLRTAEVIAVGSEMLGSTRLDTNSLFLSTRLDALGIELRAKSVVGDDRTALAEHFRQALSRVDLVVLTGGLGPTSDDVTREAVAEVLELELVEDGGILTALEQRFVRRGLRMPAVNRQQAQVPRGARPLDNPNGTAPGLWIERGDRLVILLPGPPRELQPMLDALVAGPLSDRAGADRLYRASVLMTGQGESLVEEATQPTYAPWRHAAVPIETTILASPGQVELHFVARSPDPAAAGRALADAQQAIVRLMKDDVFSLDGQPLEEVVGGQLAAAGLTIAAAESCTGGLMMSRLTDVPGSSAYVSGGVIVYSNESKTALAGVPPALIAAHGAVSEPVAVALAEGIRERTGASIGVGITGIAGPTGGTPQKPVGTVAIAATLPSGAAQVRMFSFHGHRLMVKFQAAQAGLDMVRRLLLAPA